MIKVPPNVHIKCILSGGWMDGPIELDWQYFNFFRDYYFGLPPLECPSTSVKNVDFTWYYDQCKKYAKEKGIIE